MKNKITILYADDLSVYKNHPFLKKNGEILLEKVLTFHQNNVYSLPQSERIEFIKNFCENILKQDFDLYFITNDYNIMRLLEFNVPEDRFYIYNYDADKYVNKFIDVKPNPTLEVGEYIFRIAIKQALKRG